MLIRIELHKYNLGLIRPTTWFVCCRPTELDAAVFGHLYTLITTALPADRLTEIVQAYTNLAEFCQRVHQQYFVDVTNSA